MGFGEPVVRKSACQKFGKIHKAASRRPPRLKIYTDIGLDFGEPVSRKNACQKFHKIRDAPSRRPPRLKIYTDMGMGFWPSLPSGTAHGRNSRSFAPGVPVSRTTHAFFARLAITAGAHFLSALRASKFAAAGQPRQTRNQLINRFAADMASSK
jgi:hypothetical protein